MHGFGLVNKPQISLLRRTSCVHRAPCNAPHDRMLIKCKSLNFSLKSLCRGCVKFQRAVWIHQYLIDVLISSESLGLARLAVSAAAVAACRPTGMNGNFNPFAVHLLTVYTRACVTTKFCTVTGVQPTLVRFKNTALHRLIMYPRTDTKPFKRRVE